MKHQFWRKPEMDDKRWYCTFRAVTDGNTVHHEFPRPTIRGVLAFLGLGVPAAYVALQILALVVIAIEAIGRGSGV